MRTNYYYRAKMACLDNYSFSELQDEADEAGVSLAYCKTWTDVQRAIAKEYRDGYFDKYKIPPHYTEDPYYKYR